MRMAMLLVVLGLLFTTACVSSQAQTNADAPALTATAADEPGKGVLFRDGAHCLFIGHSFFVPVAKSFDRIARRNDLALHHTEMVFAGGPKGSPGALWKDDRRRKRIEQKLSTGKVDLLGMTAGKSPDLFADYARWIDLALKHNPDTRFFIGVPWTPGGPKVKTAKFDELVDHAGEQIFEVVARLRKAYPNTTIYFLNYGKTASLMRASFDAGELDDVKKLVGRGDDALFRDGMIGHAGPMMLELSALSWLDLIYEADIAKLERTDYDASDVEHITTAVRKHNEQYR
jgi:hypothetical protein